MGRKARMFCCDTAHKCGFTHKCKHAKPHKEKASCSTPCKRKLGKYKCREMVPCKHCEGKGYKFKGMRI